METYEVYVLFENLSMFKSYYVVWKQKSVDEKEIIEISLNRTM